MNDRDTEPQQSTSWVAALIRGAVRLMVPLACLFVLFLLLYSAQGRDVLRALISAFTHPDTGYAIDGILFLMIGSAALSLSVWYSSRWLLTGQMPGLPLPPIGSGQTWVPRVMGFLAPLAIAVGLVALNYGGFPLEGRDRDATWCWAFGFAALAVALFAFYIVRRRLIAWIEDWSAKTSSGAVQPRLVTLRPQQIGTHEPMPTVSILVVIWSGALSVSLLVLFVLFPIALPRAVGAAAVAALALASINLVGSFVLTYVPLRSAFPPISLWVILLAGALGYCNDNHWVLRTEDPQLEGDAFDGLQAIADAIPQDGVTLFVASEGGGIRAAYWTAAVLDQLDARGSELQFRERLRLLSGVSGGSLGVAAWIASHRREFCPNASAVAGTSVTLSRVDSPPANATRDLSADFVAPAIAGMFYGDLVQRILPVAIARLDRSRAIEGAWQRAFSHWPNQPFEHTLSTLYRDCPELPQLVLNATRVETGERVALTLVPTKASPSEGVFLNTFDGMLPGSDLPRQSLAGHAHHSARFPVVSPAGTVAIEGAQGDIPPSFRLVDGGYFDNSGVESALDVIDAVRRKLGPDRAFRPVLLMIRNTREPLVDQTAHPSGASGFFPEVGSIALALLNVRSSHAVTARANACREMPDDVIDLAVDGREMEAPDAEVPEVPNAEAPLGWALSSAARDSLDRSARTVAKRAASKIGDRIAGHRPAHRDCDE